MGGASAGGDLPVNWASLSVAESDGRPDLVGRPVVDLAAERGVHARST